MSDYYLPQEVVLEILCRLPIRSVVICMAVCKAWYSLITSPSFISNHLDKSISFKSLTKTNRLLLRLCSLEFANDDVHGLEHYVIFVDDEASYKYDLDPPFNQGRQRERFDVVGSCNGLVCLAYRENYIHTYILWNPIIRKALVVPKPSVTSFFNCFLGFGFHSKINDYKLLRFVQLGADYEPQDSFEVELYSLNSNSWKNITPIATEYGIPTQYGLNYGHSFVNGSIHFLATCKNWPREKPRNFVLGFHLNEEGFHEIPLPECLGDIWLEDANLLKYGQSSIALTCCFSNYDQHCVWVMKEYGVATSWTQVLNSLLPEIPRVLAFRHNGEVVIEMFAKVFGGQGACLASLDVENHEIEALTTHPSLVFDHSFVDSFVESLVLLDKGEYANAAMWHRIEEERSKLFKFNKIFKKNDTSIVRRLLNFEGFKSFKGQLVNAISKYWNEYKWN